MSWEIDEPAPTPDEIAEARALAESLDGGRTDRLGAAGAVRLLREEPADELAMARLRRSLVTAAGRRRVLRHALAAAAALLLGAGLLWLPRGHAPAPTDATLAAREREARASLARLLESRSPGADDGVARIATALVAARQESLLSSLTRERTATLYGSQAAPIASPTPGGRS